MVTIVSTKSNESIVTEAVIKVTGARNAAHALDMALTELDRMGGIVCIEAYESTKDHETGEYTITVY